MWGFPVAVTLSFPWMTRVKLFFFLSAGDYGRYKGSDGDQCVVGNSLHLVWWRGGPGRDTHHGPTSPTTTTLRAFSHGWLMVHISLPDSVFLLDSILYVPNRSILLLLRMKCFLLLYLHVLLVLLSSLRSEYFRKKTFALLFLLKVAFSFFFWLSSNLFFYSLSQTAKQKSETISKSYQMSISIHI